jgi:DNA-binding LacI/PurR family transcriptional regulator
MNDDASSPRARARRRRQPAASIHAVAARAGVSISTVSRCLSGKRKLAPEVERRILEAARALHYTPNRLARSLRTQRTMALGMIIPDNSNPYFSDVVKGAEDVARAAGYVLMLSNSGEDRARERDHLSTLEAFRCDGALVIPAPPGEDEEPRRRPPTFSIPVVALGREPDFDVDVVLAESLGPSREAVAHLIKLGHRRVAIITLSDKISTTRERVGGWRAALEAAGLKGRPEYEVHVPLSVDDGFAATTRLLALPRPPTAIFATSNALGIGAVGAVEARGLRCPDDVSVVGYDSYPWQDVFHPRLTTVRQPAYQIGQRAAQLLIDRITGKKLGPPERIVLSASLVVRESSGPCKTA